MTYCKPIRSRSCYIAYILRWQIVVLLQSVTLTKPKPTLFLFFFHFRGVVLDFLKTLDDVAGLCAEEYYSSERFHRDCAKNNLSKFTVYTAVFYVFWQKFGQFVQSSYLCRKKNDDRQWAIIS